MIRSTRGLIASGFLALVLGLIVMFPARIAIGWMVPDELAIGGIQGTAWNGSAKEASVNGIYLRDLKWSLNAFGLFTGKLSYTVEATPLSGFFEADVSIGFDRVLYLSNLTAALPLRLLADAAGINGLQGDASLTFERVQIMENLAIAADGVVRIANLVVPIVSRESLGGYQADFFTQDDGIGASIEDTDGVLDLAGSLQINKDRSYVFIAQVIAKSETPPGLRQQLRFLPPGNARGQQELRLEGIL